MTITIEQGRSSDGAMPRQHERHGKGSLTTRDLGYFNLDVFEEQMLAEECFLSRLQYGTDLRLRSGNEAEDDVLHGQALDVLTWLAKQPGPFVDQLIHLGQAKQLTCRMIACRLPKAQADRRRQKLRSDTRRRKGREPGAERLAWCDWSILVTNVQGELLKPPEAVILYRARWTIEVYFRVLEGGCRVEDVQLETTERFEACLAMYMIAAWRMLYLLKLGRE